MNTTNDLLRLPLLPLLPLLPPLDESQPLLVPDADGAAPTLNAGGGLRTIAA
jgi:hypothetical protein